MGGASGNHQGRPAGVSQVNGAHRFGTHLCLSAGWEEHSTKEQWHLLALLSLERAALTLAPPALTPELVNSITFHVLVVPFVLLPHTGAQSESVSEPVCVGALKWDVWDFSSPPSGMQSLLVFMETPFPGTCALDCGAHRGPGALASDQGGG